MYKLNNRVKLGILIAAVLISRSVIASEPARQTIKYGMAEWNPISYVENNQPKGLAVDAIKEVAKELGVDIQLKVLPLRRLVYETGNKAIDCAVLPKGTFPFTTSERVALRVYMKLFYKLSKVDSSRALPTSVEDLKGRDLILIRGASYNKLTEPLLTEDNKKNIHTASSHLASVRMLDLGRGEFLLNYLVPFATGVKKAGLSMQDFGSVTIQQLDGHLMCGNPDISQEVVDKIADRGYQHIREGLIPYGVTLPKRD